MSLEDSLTRIAAALEKLASQAPQAPVPQAPMPQAPVPQAAFNDLTGLSDYVKGMYQNLSAEKREMAQKILMNFGAKKLTDLSPGYYSAFFMHMEALKNG